MSWTDERVEQLKQMWIDGLSASQSAARLGGVTRNAVIGKVHRLGLSGRGAPTRVTRRRPAAPRAPRSTTASSVPKREAASKKAAIAPAPEPEELEVISDPDAQANLLELNEQTCKWPIGDPGDENFHFCGQRSAPGLPYCAAHAKMAYQPLPSRRERKDRPRQFPNRMIG
ncbi:MAG: GcrA family cell cycle regulator [Candidatus Phaeomarinobacter sp.]